MTFSPAAPRPAAVVILTTRDGRVLVGERSDKVAFLPGFIAFPGGRVEPEDRALGGGPDEHAGFRAAALRELVEEVGLALAGGHAHPVHGDLRARPLADVHAELGLPFEPERLELAGRWITPEAAPMRFDTCFFLATIEHPVEVAPSPEFSWASFVSPGELLARWRRFEVLISPPTLHALEVLAEGFQDAAARLVAIPEAMGIGSLEFQALPGIGVLPLRTPTLPPAHHTNTYLVGEERLLVVDPATYEPSEREVLRARIARREARGARVEAIVLTHHHRDHVGAAEWLSGALGGVPILAHPRTKELLAGEVRVDRTLDEGDLLDLGPWSGGGRFVVEVLHTPGHAPGHLVLVDRRAGARAMIVGDMIAGIGTIIIDPPEGDMAEYLAQLGRLRARPEAILFPAHGGASIDGHAKLDQYVAHRLAREVKVRSALEAAGRPCAPEELLPRAYDDTPAALYPLAARSCLAHLEKLVRDGIARRTGDLDEVRFVSP